MGGGPAGRVRLPGITEPWINELIESGKGSATTITAINADNTSTALEAVPIAQAANPYENVAAYNPDQDIQKSQARLDTFLNIVDSVDEQNDWESFLDTALGRIDEMVVSESQIDTEATDFATKTLGNLARSTNRLLAGFADIGAVNSTALPTGLAILESEYNHDLSRFRTERTAQFRREKVVATLQAIEQIIGMFNMKAQSSVASAQAQQQMSLVKIASKTDQLRVDTGLNIDESSWDLDVLLKGAKLSGVMAGAPVLERGPTQMQSILSGVATGIGAGLQLGAVTGNVGIGLIGAIAGAFGGLAGGQDAFKNA